MIVKPRPVGPNLWEWELIRGDVGEAVELDLALGAVLHAYGTWGTAAVRIEGTLETSDREHWATLYDVHLAKGLQLTASWPIFTVTDGVPFLRPKVEGGTRETHLFVRCRLRRAP